MRIGNFFENAGALVRHNIVDDRLFCDLWSAQVIGAWGSLEEAVVNRRRVVGPGLWENFEYLAVLSDRYAARNPHGTYPSNLPRKTLPDPWPDDVAKEGVTKT